MGNVEQLTRWHGCRSPCIVHGASFECKGSHYPCMKKAVNGVSGKLLRLIFNGWRCSRRVKATKKLLPTSAGGYACYRRQNFFLGASRNLDTPPPPTSALTHPPFYAAHLTNDSGSFLLGLFMRNTASSARKFKIAASLYLPGRTVPIRTRCARRTRGLLARRTALRWLAVNAGRPPRGKHDGLRCRSLCRSAQRRCSCPPDGFLAGLGRRGGRYSTGRVWLLIALAKKRPRTLSCITASYAPIA